jgi:4-amino-4-deoxy-L-arabinose transferase-like glycosyltransferase
MSTVPETATPGAPAAAGAAEAPAGIAAAGASARVRLPLAKHTGLIVVVALSAVLNTVHLAQNGYANIFYSAGVRSMLRSLHNFFFVSFDPGGLVSVDKPPLGLWLQAASAKVFGFSPDALLLPEAVVGVLTVAALYVILARRLGPVVAFAGAFSLAVFPSFVAVSRDNGVDPLLVLLMLLACGAGIRACETGRWRWVLTSGILVGLAFNTKTLAAYLVLPGIIAALAVCGPGSLLRRAGMVAALGAATLVVSFAWIGVVEATPTSSRPYVGGSTNNTELGLTFGYNGFGRVEGQVGGPGDVHGRPGARVPASQLLRPPARPAARHGHAVAHRPRTAPAGPDRVVAAGQGPGARAAAAGALSTYLPDGRLRNPIPFGGEPSPVRLFGKGLGDQAGWMVPLALFGLFALTALAVRRLVRSRSVDEEAAAEEEPSEPELSGRRDPRLALLLALGGWFAVEAVVLSASKGIVHPYYVSALAPATGAMAGAGSVAFVKLRRGGAPMLGMTLAAFGVICTVAAQIVILHREHYMLWYIPLLVGGALLGLGLLMAKRSLAAPGMVLAFCALAAAPTAYATTTWLAPVEGTFPAAGPKEAIGDGGLGVGGRTLAIDRALLAYVSTHHPGSRWAILTVSAPTAAPFVLQGLDAGAVGGYSGIDPTLDGPGLARLVKRGEARYVLLGGEYSSRGGNGATAAVLAGCRQMLPSTWNSPYSYPDDLTLFDCAGRERQLQAG